MSMPIVKTKHLLEANHRASERIKELEAERDRLRDAIRNAIAVLNTVESEAWEKNIITYGTATRVASVLQACRASISRGGK